MNKRKKRIEKEVLAEVLNCKGYSTNDAISTDYHAWTEVPAPLLRIDWADPHMISWMLTVAAATIDQYVFAAVIGETMAFEAATWPSELEERKGRSLGYYVKHWGKKQGKKLWKRVNKRLKERKRTIRWALGQLVHYARYEDDPSVVPDIILQAMVKSNQLNQASQLNVARHKAGHQKALREWRNTP